MIPVVRQQEPPSFDAKVRQKGLRWLSEKGIDPNRPLEEGTGLEPYWQDCLDEMHASYSGYCAYLAVYIERVVGGGSVDHFVAKSQRVDLAYEWNNYRLACSRMNGRKGTFNDILDPFDVKTGWFRLELVSGRIFPNPKLSKTRQQSVQATIDRLKLDDAGCREIRARHYQEYCEKLYTEYFLKKRSPFIWAEAKRQRLL